MSARTQLLRIHYRAPGRSFAACSIAPVARVSSERAEVTCTRCREALAADRESTRALPPLGHRALHTRASGARTT